jgi:hypothetical protein
MMRNLTEEQVREVFKIHRPWRTYFDSGSHQFNQTDYTEKINTLGRLVYFNVDLRKLITDYKSYYSSDRRIVIRENVRKTLIGIISYIRKGVSYHYLTIREYENAPERTVITELIKTLKDQVLTSYSFEKYIEGFAAYQCGQDGSDYFRQKDFFKIDFEKPPVFLERRDLEDNLESLFSYKHLYNALNWQLFRYLHENNIDQLYPQMGMAKNLEKLVENHFPDKIREKLIKNDKARKKALLNFVKEIIEIVYLYKPYNSQNACLTV